MKVKIGWEGLPNSEADVSATVETNVLLDKMLTRNVTSLQLQIHGIVAQLDDVLDKYRLNLGMLDDIQTEKLTGARCMLEECSKSLEARQDQQATGEGWEANEVL